MIKVEHDKMMKLDKEKFWKIKKWKIIKVEHDKMMKRFKPAKPTKKAGGWVLSKRLLNRNKLVKKAVIRNWIWEGDIVQRYLSTLA